MADNEDDLVDYDEEEVRQSQHSKLYFLGMPMHASVGIEMPTKPPRPTCDGTSIK